MNDPPANWASDLRHLKIPSIKTKLSSISATSKCYPSSSPKGPHIRQDGEEFGPALLPPAGLSRPGSEAGKPEGRQSLYLSRSDFQGFSNGGVKFSLA